MRLDWACACLVVACVITAEAATPVELGAGDAGVSKGSDVSAIEARVRAMRKPGYHPAAWAAVKAAEAKVPKGAVPQATRGPSKATIAADLAALDKMEHKDGKSAPATSKADAHVKAIEAKVRALRTGKAAHHELGDSNSAHYDPLTTGLRNLPPAVRKQMGLESTADKAQDVENDDIKPYLADKQGAAPKVNYAKAKTAKKTAKAKKTVKAKKPAKKKKAVSEHMNLTPMEQADAASKAALAHEAALVKRDTQQVEKNTPVPKKKPEKPAKPLTPMQKATAATRAAEKKEGALIKQEEKKEQQMSAKLKSTRAATAKLEMQNSHYPDFVKLEEQEAETSKQIRHEPIAKVKADYKKAKKEEAKDAALLQKEAAKKAEVDAAAVKMRAQAMAAAAKREAAVDKESLARLQAVQKKAASKKTAPKKAAPKKAAKKVAKKAAPKKATKTHH